MDKFKKYVPNGKLQGDDSPMPSRGTGTGVTDGYGADLAVDSTNRQGSIRGATKSDPWNESEVDDPTFGPAPGDSAEDSKEK